MAVSSFPLLVDGDTMSAIYNGNFPSLAVLSVMSTQFDCGNHTSQSVATSEHLCTRSGMKMAYVTFAAQFMCVSDRSAWSAPT